jgi:hypothetical protein
MKDQIIPERGIQILGDQAGADSTRPKCRLDHLRPIHSCCTRPAAAPETAIRKYFHVFTFGDQSMAVTARLRHHRSSKNEQSVLTRCAWEASLQQSSITTNQLLGAYGSMSAAAV